MRLKLLWMYHDLMDLYGDIGNIKTLEYRCKARNIECITDLKTIGDEIDFSDYDLVFIGGGADKEQLIIKDDLLQRRTNIIKAIKEKTFFLLICGGYQLFGKYYLDASDQMIEGLNIFDYFTEAGKSRCIGNLVIEANLEGKTITCVGFENHAGQTKNVRFPLGKVVFGNGNEYQSQFEGYFDGNVLGTYMHGPLLPKNSELADFILIKALSKNNGFVELEKIDDNLEKEAKEHIIKKVLKK